MTIFNKNIEQKLFFFFDMFLRLYRAFSMKETLEYVFDGVNINAWCWFDMDVGDGFFMAHFEFIFIVSDSDIVGVSDINF